VSVTPVTPVSVTSVAPASQGGPSVVTTAAAHGLSAGSPFVFQDLNQPAGVTAGQTYFVKQVLSPTSFTFAQSPSGGAVTGASARGGDISALATVRRVTNRAGGAVFNPPPGTYRVTLVRREPGFQAVPIAEDGQVAATTGDLSEWVTVSNSSDQQTVQFQYER